MWVILYQDKFWVGNKKWTKNLTDAKHFAQKESAYNSRKKLLYLQPNIDPNKLSVEDSHATSHLINPPPA